MIDVLHKICNIILKSGEWPESIVITVLYRKRGMLGNVIIIEQLASLIKIVKFFYESFLYMHEIITPTYI